MNQKQRAVIIIPVVLLLTAFAALAEFHYNIFERIAGAYLEARNAQRKRLPKFVDRETRNVQAQQQVETLLSLKGQHQEEEQPEPDPAGPAEIVRLDEGRKVIMTRARFLEARKKLARTAHAIPQPAQAPETADYDDWSRIIMVRAGWLRPGALFLVDDRNYTLFELPLSAEQFDLLNASAVSDSSAFDGMASKMRVYTPQRFFAMMRGLPEAERDQIIDPGRLLDLESAARRVGILDSPEQKQPRIVIETVVQHQAEIASIPVTKPLLQAIEAGLGEAAPPSGVSISESP